MSTMKMNLVLTTRTHPKLLGLMAVHYSQPKGFVGRNLCYAIVVDHKFYGYIVGGSATKHLPGRNEFFRISPDDLNMIVNNIFFHVRPIKNGYPTRNFVPLVIKTWRERIQEDWWLTYRDEVRGFETLVELPRSGECYKRDKWQVISQTRGYTCKRMGGTSTDTWTGRRVWNTNPGALRPKLVLVRFP